MRLSCIAAVLSTALVACLGGAPSALAAQSRTGEAKSAAVRRAPTSGRRAAESPAPATGAGQARAEKAATEARAEEAAPATRGPARIDFDDRLIQGQTNKSGAVYLFDRKELVIRSMVQQRTSYRQQIVQDVLAE